MSCRFLFVYGTLMSRAVDPLGAMQRSRLARESRSLGAARVTARLYDLGEYPGLVLSNLPTDVVHGELLELSTPAASFQWLDAYEGVRPGGGGAGDEYLRQRVPVRLEAGGTHEAWVYVYAWSVSGGRLASDGRWRVR